jgi:hypothetical protein
MTGRNGDGAGGEDAPRRTVEDIVARIEAAGLSGGFAVEDLGDRFIVRDLTDPPANGRRRRALIRDAVMGWTDVWVGAQPRGVPYDPPEPLQAPGPR